MCREATVSGSLDSSAFSFFPPFSSCPLQPRIVSYCRFRVRLHRQDSLLSSLWSEHDSVAMHVDWARSREDDATARALMPRLRELGADIEQLQQEMDTQANGQTFDREGQIEKKYQNKMGEGEGKKNNNNNQRGTDSQANRTGITESDTLLRRK